MTFHTSLRVTLILAVCIGLSACGNSRTSSSAGGSGAEPAGGDEFFSRTNDVGQYEGSSIWDVFGPNKSEQTVKVNRYLWVASLDVLSFLPVQTVDPFTGVIVTGYGTPPGGGRTYRATVHIKDPALAARSLQVSLQSKGGPVNAATTRAVEDAILSRARQLRIADNKL